MEAQGLRDDLKEMAEKLRTLTISERESRKVAEDLQAEMDLLRAEAATNRRQFQNYQEEKVCTQCKKKNFIFNLGLHDDAVEFSKE